VRRPRFSPIWRDRDFRRFWVGDSISMIGSGVTAFALPIIAVVILHVTPGQMGVLRALNGAPAVVVGLLAGAWVDRVSRRRLLIGLNLLEGALLLVIPIAYALDRLTLGLLMALWVAFGLLLPFWWASWNALLPAIVERDLLVEANSKMMFSWSATGVTGPALGGVLVSLLTAPGAILVDSASYVVSAVALAGVRTKVPEVRSRERPPPVRRPIAEGMRATFRDPLQRAITTPRVLLDFVDAMSGAVFFIYVLREVALPKALLGVALAIGALGFVGGSLAAPRLERRLGAGWTIVLGLGMVAASPYTMVLAHRSLPDAVNVACFALPGVIGGAGGIIQFIALSSLRQSITSDAVLGRVYASSSWLGRVLTVVGALVGGFLGERIGLRPTILVCALAYAVPFVYAVSSPLRSAVLPPAGSTTSSGDGEVRDLTA
jgi:MFS family permease